MHIEAHRGTFSRQDNRIRPCFSQFKARLSRDFFQASCGIEGFLLGPQAREGPGEVIRKESTIMGDKHTP